MKTLRILFVLLVSILGFGQEMPVIIPPTPEATQITKFIEIPVDYSNGLPTINIPIFTIEQDGVVIPISLDYHARGIKVDEVASRVGTGWVLNAGGIISRQTRGLPDESSNLLVSISEAYESLENRNRIFRYYFGPGQEFLEYGNPDQFYYSIPSSSGKFVFDYTDNEALIQNQKNSIKISRNGSNFTLIDKEGNNYSFGGSNVSKEFALGNYVIKSPELNVTELDDTTLHIVPSAYNLNKISTVSNSYVEFLYKNIETYHFRRSYDKYNPPVYVSGSTANDVITIPGYVGCYYSKIKSEEKVIEEIIFDKGRVVFENSSQLREDVINGEKLEWIKIYNKKNHLIKKIKLNYFYSDNNNGQNIMYHLYNLDPAARKRLFLDNIEFIDVYNNNKKEVYEFQYDLIKPMPNRHSNSKDVWGYYNGANNGIFSIPFGQDGRNRRVNSSFSGVGLLKKITYPSGGFTNYIYEDNITIKNGNIDDVVFSGGDPNPLEQKNVTLSNLEYQTCFNGNFYSKPFTVGEGMVDNANYTLWFTNNFECQTGRELECKFSVWIESVNVTPRQTFSISLDNNLISVFIPGGEYLLKVKPKFTGYDPTSMDDGFYINIQWNEVPEGFLDALCVGGKRIKKIEKYDYENSLVLKNEYEYKTDNGELSGRLNGLPDFYSVFEYINVNGERKPVIWKFGSGNGSPLGTFQGNSVSYSQVTEYKKSQDDVLGKSVYNFSVIDDTGDYWLFPPHPPTDNEWLRGLPLKERYYGFNNGQYQLKKQIENKYVYGFRNSEYNTDLPPDSDLAQMSVIDYIGFPPAYTIPKEYNITDPKYMYRKEKGYFRLPYFIFVFHNLNFPNKNVDRYWLDLFPTNQTSETKIYYKTFYMTGGFVNKKQTIVTDYLDSGDVVTEMNYKYNNPNHLQLTSQITTSSTGDTTETTYSYAHDLDNQAMIDKNMIGIPLKTEVKKNGAVLSTQETVYKDWDPDANKELLAPWIIKTSKGSADLENRIQYNELDIANGNPLEVQQASGIPITYIWGYNKTQPIAKIENATYAQVQPYETNLQTLSNGNNEASLIAALNNLRTILPNAMITTYTYKPLIGVSTITDPKGNTIKYHYDGFGRLEFVKDKDGNILSENKYHYRTQN